MKSEFERIALVQPLMKSLYEASKESLGFDIDAKIVVLTNEGNSNNPLGKTAYYDPADHKIGLYTQGRHVKDIMRSLSHELVHHSQNCRGDFKEGIATIEGYAQEDGHLREMEREAYETGNLIFRDWEDNYKRNDNNKLFNNTSIMGEKLMEDKDIKLREVIRGLVREMLVSIKEEGDGDYSSLSPDMVKATAAQQQAADAGAAALAAESPAGEEEQWAAASGDEGEGLDEGELGAQTNCHPMDFQCQENELQGQGRKSGTGGGVAREAKEIEESLNESFFPITHDIREKARQRTHDSLMKRWGYNKKGSK